MHVNAKTTIDIQANRLRIKRIILMEIRMQFINKNR